MDEIRGTYDFRGKITVDQAWNIGKALAEWLPSEGMVAVAGRQGAQLFEAVVEGLRLQGRNVVSLMNSDRASLEQYISEHQLAGGARISFDDLEQVSTIELFDHATKLISGENGLDDIAAMVEAGNFVPAAKKGDLSALA